jgi:hypothetical protein
MKYRYLFGLCILGIILGCFTACGGITSSGVEYFAGEPFSLYTYNDRVDHGDSSITMRRETLQNEKGEEETVWTLSGTVTTTYADGYAGVVLQPNSEILAHLRNGAETIKLRISGDDRRYRFSVDTENVKDGNNFGRDITAFSQVTAISIPIADLEQEPGWGEKVTFDRTVIKNLKIETRGQPIQSFRFSIHSVEIF